VTVDPARSPSAEQLVWADKNIGNLSKAKRADVFSYTVQGFDDSPDVFVGGAALADAVQITRTNPFQADFAWGRSSLVDYRNTRGERLQGALYHPAGYVPDRQYPMIVYVYERLSQGVHNYVGPSERSPYNAAVFTANGYFVLQPDIVFRPRDPGIAALDCVTAAVKAVLATGMVIETRGPRRPFLAIEAVSSRPRPTCSRRRRRPDHEPAQLLRRDSLNQGLPEPAHFETGQACMDVLPGGSAGHIRNRRRFSSTSCGRRC
jgi:hypothetical protein